MCMGFLPACMFVGQMCRELATCKGQKMPCDRSYGRLGATVWVLGVESGSSRSVLCPKSLFLIRSGWSKSRLESLRKVKYIP